MIDVQQARQEYIAARDALNAIARSDQATAAQRDDARSARDELTLNYINGMAAAGTALTNQYREFIGLMTDVIDQLTRDHTVASSLLQVKNLVDRASDFAG